LCREKGCFKWVDKSRHKEHRCGEVQCKNCEEHHIPSNDENTHRCIVKTVEVKESLNNDKYAVWDIESSCDYDLLGQSSEHICNCIVLKYLFSDEPSIKWTGMGCMDDFASWVLEQKRTTFLAHNGKAYDTWLLHKYLVKHSEKRPSSLVLAGNKIMSMTIGSNKFLDTLNHFGCGLAKLPKMWGMDKNISKGYFPYKFNTKSNEDYVGKMPDMIYYDCDKMPSNARKDFMDWYVNEKKQFGNNYNFKNELLSYCEQDVLVLQLACETYINTFTEILETCIENCTCTEEQQTKMNVFNPFTCCTIASLALKVQRVFFYNDVETPIYIHTGKEYDFIKRSFSGGRTEPISIYKKMTAKELMLGLVMKYIDITSLYPSVQFLDMLPYDLGIWKEPPNLDTVTLDSGFYEVDINCPNDLMLPVLGESRNGKFMFDLLPKVKQVYTHLELNKALSCGYKITKFYNYLHFKMTDQIFKGYMGTFYKLKCYSDEKPDDMDAYIKHHSDLGIKLDPKKFVPNAPLKSMFKLLLNSNWGKWGEKKNQLTNKYITNAGDFNKLIKRAWNDEINLKNIQEVQTFCAIDNEVYAQYEELKDENTSLSKSNVAIASMTTSNARLRLYKEMELLGDRVIYSDTDSIVHVYDPAKYNTPISGGLGLWTAETKSPIVEWISPISKSYAYLTLEDSLIKKKQSGLKFKGVTQNYANDKTIHIDAMKQSIVQKSQAKLTAMKTDFVKNNRAGTIHVKENIKVNDLTYNKRYVVPYKKGADFITTLPLGHKDIPTLP